MLLTQGQNNYLFTGDLEAEGEESLVEENDLPECKLFKAGHHGSPTSNGAKLMAEIRPEIVVVCCCCGNYKEYNFGSMDVVFPSQTFVNNVAPYTDRIYVPTLYSETEGFVPMNGNIVLSSDGGGGVGALFGERSRVPRERMVQGKPHLAVSGIKGKTGGAGI